MKKIATYNLSGEQRNVVAEMVKKGVYNYGNYTLDEVDADMLDAWINNAKEEGDSEYVEFFAKTRVNAKVYTLNDHLGYFSQPIGEVVIYDC